MTVKPAVACHDFVTIAPVEESVIIFSVLKGGTLVEIANCNVVS